MTNDPESLEVLPSEAARILGCLRQLVVQLFDAGKVAGRRGPGGYRLLDRAAVEALARERRERQEARG